MRSYSSRGLIHKNQGLFSPHTTEWEQTGHIELEQVDENTTNPDKIMEDNVLAMDFLEFAGPGRYKTPWSISRNNFLTGADN